MRLIDADELEKKCLSDIQDNDANIWDIMNNIRRMKTAYDIDKVVEELEDEKQFWKDIHFNQDISREKSISYEHAIEIVKGGVKNEH